MNEASDKEIKRLSETLNIPEDVLRAICRLESKRLWREQNTPERLADLADELLDREKERGL